MSQPKTLTKLSLTPTNRTGPLEGPEHLEVDSDQFRIFSLWRAHPLQCSLDQVLTPAPSSGTPPSSSVRSSCCSSTDTSAGL